MTDFMSDEEIRENLLKRGVNIGPVVDSTRAFYRRKLAKLLGEIKDEPVPHSSDAEGSASENETNEEKEEHVQEELFSQSNIPPVQIRGRRSTSSYSGSSPPKSSYTYSISNTAPAPTANKGNTVLFSCFLLGTALILYLAFFYGDSTETAVELK